MIVETPEKPWTVYVLTSPSGKRYVGITQKTPEERWRHGTGYKPNHPVRRAINKYGWGNFQHEIVASGLTKEEAGHFEQFLIKKLNTMDRRYGYNQTSGGETAVSGAELSPEAHERLRKAQAGKRRGS